MEHIMPYHTDQHPLPKHYTNFNAFSPSYEVSITRHNN